MPITHNATGVSSWALVVRLVDVAAKVLAGCRPDGCARGRDA